MPWKKAGRELYKRPDNHTQCDLTDAEWAVLEPLVPKRGGMGRPRATDPRRVFDAVQYMPQTGCQWRMIPACYPPFTTVQHHFHAWRDSGVFGNMPDALRGMARDLAERAAEPTAAAVDSRTVKTTGSGGPAGYDAGKRIKGRKRRIATDAGGFPVTVAVHEASVQDRDGAPAVIPAMLEKAPQVAELWADGGYAGPKPERALKDRGPEPILSIIHKPGETKGFTVLYRRWVVERAFAWMSRCRRPAKDFERTPAGSPAWAQLAACRFLMRRIARGITP